jgi:ureidoglycolate lyase
MAPTACLTSARSALFRVPGDAGLNYRADTWHHPLSALERTGRFAILTFVDGTSADEQFVDLPQEVVIEA